VSRSKNLAVKYLAAAVLLFGVMTLSGVMSAIYYINPEFLFGLLPFSIAKTLHIDTMIIWLLMGFMGSVYWFLPEEFGREPAGIWAAEILFWIFVAAVLAVAAIFLFIQWGPATEATLWLVQQGRKYVEAPRWAAIGVTFVMLVFAWNVVGTALKAHRITGIMAVMSVNMVPLVLLYLIAFPRIDNMAVDLYWWWWLVHLWVEATWEILIGCIMALAVMKLLGTSRKIVEGWLYIEVGMVLGTGILGLGHHYFWIGTPDYWLGIGGFFSALEPLPLLGMVVHAIYDAGVHHMKTANRPAFYWTLAEAFGNFLGGGVFGFMITLPQLNLFAHGTQWTVSHGHFAFWGAYGCGVLSICYIALQERRQLVTLNGPGWVWAFVLLNGGLIGMVGALLVAGMAQAFFERAIGGSTLEAFIAGQENPWFVLGMYSRFGFGLMFGAGYLTLVWNLLMLGRRRETGFAAKAVPAE
jgi:nitric oxide reductase subunit B